MVFPASLASQAHDTSSAWKIGKRLTAKINGAGVTINQSKVRMQYRQSRQVVTGLTVNKKVNIRADYYRLARAMAQNLFATGAYFIEDEEVKSLDRLEGILNHVHYVRDKSDQRSASEKKKAMTATRRLYRDFLFFKNFVALGLPLIVCEGKTDNIYLRAAIRNLGVHTGVLRGMDGKLLVRFLNHESKSAEILQLEGGTGALKFLFRDYKRNLTEFSFAPLEHPVIVLIDNDSG